MKPSPPVSRLPYSNVAAYKFVDLDDHWVRGARKRLRSRCDSLELRGTILLSKEGINLFLSGRRTDVKSFKKYITGIPPFADLSFRESYSAEHSFTRMLVKIKKEIIPIGPEHVRPVEESAPRISPTELKHWLDSGRDVVLLDTRNDFEVDLGTFEHAVDLRLRRFRDFPTAVKQLDEFKEKPVVTFCTGGIRCEKAVPLMYQLGFKKVYQLDGGILGYFEACGGDHWQGECFVFDRRVAVDCRLLETATEYCFRCQHILHATDRSDPRYVLGVSCPYCIAT